MLNAGLLTSTWRGATLALTTALLPNFPLSVFCCLAVAARALVPLALARRRPRLPLLSPALLVRAACDALSFVLAGLCAARCGTARYLLWSGLLSCSLAPRAGRLNRSGSRALCAAVATACLVLLDLGRNLTLGGVLIMVAALALKTSSAALEDATAESYLVSTGLLSPFAMWDLARSSGGASALLGVTFLFSFVLITAPVLWEAFGTYAKLPKRASVPDLCSPVGIMLPVFVSAIVEFLSGSPFRPGWLLMGSAVAFFVWDALSRRAMGGLQGNSDDLPVWGGVPVTAHITGRSLLWGALGQVWRHSKSRRLCIFLCANLVFMVVEISFGVWNNSLGLISDGCHMLLDCLALTIGLAAAVMSKLDPTPSFTYGFGRVQVLSGFINGVLLVVIAVLVFAESFHRFFDRADMRTRHLVVVALLGLVVNLVGVFAFHEGHHHKHHHKHAHENTADDFETPPSGSASGWRALQQQRRQKQRRKQDGDDPRLPAHDHHTKDHNMHGVFLHVLSDTLGSLGVIVSSVLIERYGIAVADPICSLCISLLMFASVIPLLKESALILLQCSPSAQGSAESPFGHSALSEEIERRVMEEVEGVSECRDVHVWTESPSRLVVTLRIVVDRGTNEQRALSSCQSVLRSVGARWQCIEVVLADPDRTLTT